MKKTINKALLTICALLFVLCGMMAMNFGVSSAKASDPTPQFYMDEGMSIKMEIEGNAVDAEHSGIRFTAKMNQAFIDNAEDGAKYYVMIIPSNWLENQKLSGENVDYVDVLTKSTTEGGFGKVINETLVVMESVPVYNSKDGLYNLKGTISNVKTENATNDFIGIAYRETNGAREYADFNVENNARNITNVASKVLNDKITTAEYDENVEIKYLNDIIDVAYPDLTVTAPTAVNLALEGGKSYDLNAFENVPENIDIAYSISDNSKASVENGVVSITETGATATVKATVLGKEYTLANLIEDSVFLNGYDTNESVRNLWNANASADAYKNNPDFLAQHKWHETIDDKSGVAAVNGYGGEFDLRFSITSNELKNIGLDDDDKISITYKFSGITYGVATTIFGVATSSYSYPDTWYTREFTVAEISAANNGLNTFFTNAGSDSHSLVGVRLKMAITSNSTLYIDSIRITKVEADYEVPNSNEEFCVPTAVVIGSRGAILAFGNQPTVTYQSTANSTAQAVTVENGKFKVAVGIYNLKYTINYGGENISYTLTYTVERPAMAANMLEDFDEASSLVNIWNNYSPMTQAQKEQHKWWDSYTDTNSVTKTGVVSVNCIGKDVHVKFNRTIDELKALGLDENDTISVTLLWTRDAGSMVTGIKVFGVSQSNSSLNKWYTIEISIADIIANNTDLNTFCEKAGSDGTGTLISNGIGSSATLYLADITFTKNA